MATTAAKNNDAKRNNSYDSISAAQYVFNVFAAFFAIFFFFFVVFWWRKFNYRAAEWQRNTTIEW